MSPDDLERLVGRALDTLPAPRAPHTLLTRVLAAAHAGQRPWYTAGWRSWPAGVQVAAGLLFVAAVALGMAVGPSVRAALVDVWVVASAGALAWVAGPVEEAAAVTRRAEAALEVIRILWRTILGPVIAYAAALFVLMCLVCAGFELSLTWRSRKAHSS